MVLLISVLILYTNPDLRYLRPEKQLFESCVRRKVEFLEKSNDLEFSIRGLQTRVFCLKTEPWRVIRPTVKILHVVDLKTGVSEAKNMSGYCLRFHGRYRTDSEDHYDFGRPQNLQGGFFKDVVLSTKTSSS